MQQHQPKAPEGRHRREFTGNVALSGLAKRLLTLFPGAKAAWLHAFAPPGQLLSKTLNKTQVRKKPAEAGTTNGFASPVE